MTAVFDGIRIASGTQNFLIEDVRITDARDDAIENDVGMSGTIRDSLFDGVFVGIALDGSRDASNDTILLDGVLMRMESYLYSRAGDGEITHGSPFKTDNDNPDYTPNIQIVNSVIAIERVDHESLQRLQTAWDNVTLSQNNYYLNLSDTPLPADYPMPPAGFTILQGQAARDYWNEARSTWIESHQGTGTDETPTGGNEAPLVDLDGSATGAGYAATFTENQGAVPIADRDAVIDANGNQLERLTVALTNPQAGDQLVVNLAGLPSGITVDPASTDSNIILKGLATTDDYAAAMRQFSFNNTSETPAPVSRTIKVTADDGLAHSSPAVATITIDRAPDAVGDSVATRPDTAVTTGNVLANDDLGDGPATITDFDPVSAAGGTVDHNGNGTFTYTPASGFTGRDSFTYSISDTDGDPSSAIVAVTVGSGTAVTFEKRVVSGLDDVEQRGRSMSMDSSDLELVTDGSTTQQVGLRFTGIDIPQNAVITNAYIQFQTDETGSAATSLLIRGEDTDDAAAFANVKNNLSSRATTDASAAWAPGAWNTVGQAGFTQRTSDLSDIVEEIVSRAGWEGGNDMAFVFTGSGKRTAEAFESGAATAPLLHIEYTVPDQSPQTFLSDFHFL